MACKNLQIGNNDIVMHITEDNSGIGNAADVAKSLGGTSFSFGSANDSKTAQYTFKFNVTQNCSLRSDQKTFTDAGAGVRGGVTWYSENIDTVLKPKMDAEYVAPPPPVVVIPVPVVVPVVVPEPAPPVVVVPEP